MAVPKIVLIAAVAENGVIGRDGGIALAAVVGPEAIQG